MKYLVKTNHENFVRDVNNGAVLNTNKEAYDSYKKQRDKILNNNKEILDLKNEMAELKCLLTELLKERKL